MFPLTTLFPAATCLASARENEHTHLPLMSTSASELHEPSAFSASEAETSPAIPERMRSRVVVMVAIMSTVLLSANGLVCSTLGTFLGLQRMGPFGKGFQRLRPSTKSSPAYSAFEEHSNPLRTILTPPRDNVARRIELHLLRLDRLSGSSNGAAVRRRRDMCRGCEIAADLVAHWKSR